MFLLFILYVYSMYCYLNLIIIPRTLAVLTHFEALLSQSAPAAAFLQTLIHGDPGFPALVSIAVISWG